MGAMNGLKALSVALVLFALAFGSGFQLLFRLGYAVLAVVVVSFVWTALSLTGLRLRRETATVRAQVGQKIDETLVLRNTWPLPKVWIEVRDQSTLPDHRVSRAFAMSPFRDQSWTVRTLCLRRGVYNLGPVTVVSGDPFGLFQRKRVWRAVQSLIVYPATFDLSHFQISFGPLTGGNALRQRSHHVTPNSFGIRPYAPGDSLNRIHWPSTARLRALTVKEFELDPVADIWVVLDLEHSVQAGWGDDSTEEYGVTVAASLVKHFIEQHRSVGLIAHGSHPCVFSPDRGDRQLIKILEELAVLRASGRVSLAEVLIAESARFGRNTTLIVVTPSAVDRWPAALRHEARRGVRAAVVMLDAASFSAGSARPEGAMALVAAEWPVYVIRKGDSIDASLSEPFESRGA